MKEIIIAEIIVDAGSPVKIPVQILPYGCNWVEICWFGMPNMLFRWLLYSSNHSHTVGVDVGIMVDGAPIRIESYFYRIKMSWNYFLLICSPTLLSSQIMPAQWTLHSRAIGSPQLRAHGFRFLTVICHPPVNNLVHLSYKYVVDGKP